MMRSRSLGSEGVEMVQPDVAIVNVAQQRLQSLDRFHAFVEPPRTYRTRDLQRVPQPLRRNSHGVVMPAVFRIGQAAFVLKQIVQLPKDVLLDLLASLGRLRTVGRRRSAPRSRAFFGRPPHFSQNAAGFQTVHRFDHLPLQPFAVVLQLHQHVGNARKAFLGVQRRQRAAEAFDLHVAVAGMAERFRHATDRLPPALDLLSGEALPEHRQRRPQPPRGDPRAMHELDVFRRAHSVQLLGKLLRLPADILRGESSIRGIHSS